MIACVILTVMFIEPLSFVKRHRQLLARAASRWVNRRLARVFEQWKQMLKEHKRVKHIARKVMGRWANRLLAGSGTIADGIARWVGG